MAGANPAGRADTSGMATILVAEPNPEVRDLLARVARRLGHAVVEEGGHRTQPSEVDVVLLEPADNASLEAAAPALAAGAALVCVSILPPAPEAAYPRPVAHLQKPFSLSRLERALALALEQAAAIRRVAAVARHH